MWTVSCQWMLSLVLINGPLRLSICHLRAVHKRYTMLAHCNLKQNMCFCSKQSSLFSFYVLPSGGKSKDAVVHYIFIRNWPGNEPSLREGVLQRIAGSAELGELSDEAWVRRSLRWPSELCSTSRSDRRKTGRRERNSWMWIQWWGVESARGRTQSCVQPRTS